MWLVCVVSAGAQLFDNLQAFGQRLKAGDPQTEASSSPEGPKGIATADFNQDGRADIAVANTDGSVTVFYGRADGKFNSPNHLRTGVQELRGIVATDLTGDGKPDIAVAAPYGGNVYLFKRGAGGFEEPTTIATWYGARNLAAGDFDGDGLKDLIVAGTTNGLRQLRSAGGGSFTEVTNLTELSSEDWDFPKPVYSMSAFRPAGASRDELVVTHVNTDLVWVLAPNADGALEIRGSVENQNAHSVAVGSILNPSSSTSLDLITASRDKGTIEVHRGVQTALRFEETIQQKIEVPGGPRDLQIVDLDQDGWNDVAVVIRNFDRVITYHNSNGVLVAAAEMPVGSSPREIVAANFNNDSFPDVAVMNRDSMDVSVLYTYPGKSVFGALDTVYPVDGEVSALTVFDFNGDGRDDVVQLHRASADFSVRLAGTNGVLGEPQFFPVGPLPNAPSVVDVNNDGIPDMVTANLGGMEGGSVSVRLGDGQGSFGPEQRYYLPTGTYGGLFALVAADFDNDGDIDLCAGFFDCRITFFENKNGAFEATKTHNFVYESRVMVTGDFDQDGDQDLAGAGYAGDVIVIENRGDILHTGTLRRTLYPHGDPGKFGTRDIVARDLNEDGDLDLLVGSGNGTMLFFGAEGMSFNLLPNPLPGTQFPNSAVTLGDFDGDHVQDIAVSCKILSCITILTRIGQGQYAPAVTVDVPSGTFLATGDLDGDGKADLVGSGSVLWTALSSRGPQSTPSKIVKAERNGLAKPVINEMLAINNSLNLDADGGRNSDWVEIFNGGQVALPLNGWKLRLSEGTTTNTYTFPATAFLGPGAHVLVIFSDTKRTPYHTGFKLPGSGGALALLNPSGAEIDTVQYPQQQQDVSYGRYRDGLAALAFNPYPSPGRENTDNGAVEPIVDLASLDPDQMQPGQPIRFHVNGRDDVGIVSISLLYQRLDIQDNTVNRVLLLDDGQSGDGGLSDGHFSGLLEPGLPAGAEIQFYLEVTDLSGQTVIVPSEPVFSRNTQGSSLFSLVMSPTRPPLEISEFVADNATGLQDESGGTPDWVEIRNCSSMPVPLRGLGLANSLFAVNSRFNFNADDVLPPGGYKVIYCDDNVAAGASHAPFGLNVGGDKLYLTGLTTNGGRMIVDSFAFGPQGRDVARARLGCGGEWIASSPTPLAANAPNGWMTLASRDGASFTLVFATEPNATYVVEQAGSLPAASWTASEPIAGDGIEKVITQPISGQRFFRVKKQ